MEYLNLAGGISYSIVVSLGSMLSVRTLTFELSAVPVEVTVWNESSGFPTPVLCLNYTNVVDSVPMITLRDMSGLKHEPCAIVSLFFSYSSHFAELKEYASRTGQLSVAIVVKPNANFFRNKKKVLVGIKRQVVNRLGWNTVRRALDDKPRLWKPYHTIAPLIFDYPPSNEIFKLSWDEGRCSASPDSSGTDATTTCDEQKLPNMYSLILVVRKDLDMRSGKIAAQCAHATLGACYQTLNTSQATSFMKDTNDRRIVTLRADGLPQLLELKQQAEMNHLNAYLQVDAGLTQVPVDTPTVLALGPDDPVKFQSLIKSLKLL